MACSRRYIAASGRIVQHRLAFNYRATCRIHWSSLLTSMLMTSSLISSQYRLAGCQMSRKWPVQDAKSRFSELLDTALAEGPQIVTKRGVETAVLVSIEQWQKLERMTRPDLKELLLAPEARTETLTLRRGQHRRRSQLVLE